MRKQYKAQISINNKSAHIGFFTTPAEASSAKQVVQRWVRRKLMLRIQQQVFAGDTKSSPPSA